MYYEVSLEEELDQVGRAIDYYFEWADEFRTSKYDWDFLYFYYRGLLNPDNISGIRFRALFFAMRLQPVLTFVQQFCKEHNRAPVILDLGCGFGLESILLCLSGARVHGIDSWPNMIEFAKHRLSRFENAHNAALDVQYQLANLFRFKASEQYDAVYSSATLHHIEPPAEAFQAISNLIRPEGYFFLSDENGYSPVQQLLVQKKIGWIRPRKYLRTDPDTGETSLFGNENIRPTYLWSRYMKPARLEPISVKYCRFIPSVNWPVEKLVRIERRLRKIPVIAQLGAIGFLLTAQKQSARNPLA